MKNKMMNRIQPMMKVTPKLLNKNNDQEIEGMNLYLYGDIGEDWFGYGITALQVRTVLNQIDTDVVNVHIHSNGGDAFEGIAIHNVLKQSDKTINTYIDGLAASAASIIALAGDKIYMPQNTQLMIHNAASAIYGFADDFEKMATSLRNINDSVRQTYLSRFAGTEDELIKYMNDETFFTAEQAVALNLADEILNYNSEPVNVKEDDPKEDPDKDVSEKESTDEEKNKMKNENVARFAAFANSLSKFTRKEEK